jgi:hypothetical protein
MKLFLANRGPALPSRLPQGDTKEFLDKWMHEVDLQKQAETEARVLAWMDASVPSVDTVRPGLIKRTWQNVRRFAREVSCKVVDEID